MSGTDFPVFLAPPTRNLWALLETGRMSLFKRDSVKDSLSIHLYEIWEENREALHLEGGPRTLGPEADTVCAPFSSLTYVNIRFVTVIDPLLQPFQERIQPSSTIVKRQILQALAHVLLETSLDFIREPLP